MKTTINPDSIEKGSITPEMLSSEVLSPITEELSRKVETYILDITVSNLNDLINGRINLLTPDVQALEDAISKNKRIAMKTSSELGGLLPVHTTAIPGIIGMAILSLGGLYRINLPSSGGLQASAVQMFPFISSQYLTATEQAIYELRNEIQDLGRDKYILDFTINDLNSLRDGDIEFIQFDAIKLHDELSRKTVYIKNEDGSDGLLPVGIYEEDFAYMVVLTYTGTYCIALPLNGKLYADYVSFVKSGEIAEIHELIESLQTQLDSHDVAIEDLQDNKVDKELGKGLSTNDFTTSEKEKLAELQNYDDAELRGEVESLQTEVDSHDVAIEDLQDNKVDKGDYAPALTAGFADNLVSKDVVVDSEFNLRRSGGGAISDGVARMEVVKGNSVVWNQKLKYALSQADLGKQGWWSRYGEAQMEGRKVTFTGREGANPSISQACAIVKGHAYLIVFDFSAEHTDYYGRAYRFLFSDNAYGNATQHITALEDGLTNGHRVHFMTANNNYSYCIFRIISDGLSSIPASTATFENYQLIDLTQMFGAGNEPTTIEEFYARKPIVEDEYAYNEGEVIHCNVDAVKSVGRNLFDENVMTDWEGVTKTDEGWTGDIAYFYSHHNLWENKIGYNGRVALIGKVACEKTSMNARIEVYYTDGTGESVFHMKNETSIEGKYLTATNKVVDRIAVYYGGRGQFSVYYLMIALATDGDTVEGFAYEPYKEDVRELPSAIKEVFPNGMMSAGTAHDVAYNDLNKEVGVTEKRIGVVDLGTLNWGMISTSDGNVLFRSTLKDRADAVSDLLSALCSKYIVVKQSKRTDKTISGAGSSVVDVIDSAYTDAASFKAAMAGVMLYYELAEPIVTEHQEPFNLDYQVTNGGQEQAMATEPTSAFKAEIAYGFNASAKIKENANEIAQLKATIAQLQAALASMVNENVEDYE